MKPFIPNHTTSILGKMLDFAQYMSVDRVSNHSPHTKKKALTDKQKRNKRKVAEKSRKFNRRKFGNRRH